MKYQFIFPIVLFIPLLIIQTTVIPLFAFYNAVPDLILILLVFYAISYGQIFGTILGFIFGFLLKKYSEYFIAFALFIVGLVVLQQFGYVSIGLNTAKIHEMLGLESAVVTTDGYGMLIIEWMKSNVPAAASLVVGFLLGLKFA